MDVAVLRGPTGLAQAAQGRWRAAFLFAIALQLLLFVWNWYGADRLYLAFGPMGSLPLHLAALWLAAIWDAFDTRHKARQAEPVVEGVTERA